jgi:recombination protein RecR
MNHYPSSLLKVVQHISKLPGIGTKTAERLALHIMNAPVGEAEALSRSIVDLKQKIRRCSRCFALSDGELCRLCSDASRDAGLICVVEQPGDMVAIEKSGAYKGLYHVLCGVLSPLDGVGPDSIRIRELMARVATGSVREVVLATGTSVEGDATAAYLAEQLSAYSATVSRIASGVPVGGDLKYIDQVTLKRALEARRNV